jgi:hypothetical protein
MSATAASLRPTILKGVAENLARTELIPFKMWPENLPPAPPEAEQAEIHVANGYQCVTEAWLATLQPGYRVTAWNRPWRLRAFELYPWHRAHRDKPWTFWCIKLELEAVNLATDEH